MEKQKTLTLDVAILGGGFAGVYCGKSLLKTLGRDPHTKIGLIADENYMVFQPMLPEVASGSISPRHVINPIRHLCKGIKVYKASIEKIDTKNKLLTLSPGPFSNPILVRFRHLVVSLGAKVDLSRVPGMSEHSFLMQNVGDAMKLRATILARFEEANLATDPQRRRHLLTFVVVGGGYSGVETAGQILDLFHATVRYYTNIEPSDFHVALIHSRDHLLPTLSQKLGKYAEEKLRDRGLDIHLNKRVKALTANQVYLNDGSIIETHTTVCTIGNAPHPLVTQLAKDLNVETVHGRIQTTNTMQVPGKDWVWAAGDCAAVPMPGSSDPCPSTAQFAMRQGTLMGKNINAFLRAQTIKPFTFRGVGELAAIGHHSAVAEVFGLKFSGFGAWWMWRTIYLSKLPGLDRKLRVLIDWTLDLFFPRDINLLSPRYTKPLQEAYLEPGDALFRSGEPAFSFYIVKKGCIQLTDTHGNFIKAIRDGEFFGERALLTDQKWRFTATASEQTQLIGLGSDEFKAILENSTAMRILFERSARQYRSTQEIDTLKKSLPKATLLNPVSSVMSTQISQIHNGDSIRKTLEQFNSHHHSFYPLIDSKNGTLLGVLSRDQFYDYIQSEGIDENATLENIEYQQLPRLQPDTTIEDCLETMIRSGNNKALVLDQNHALQGILSIRDLLASDSTSQ